MATDPTNTQSGLANAEDRQSACPTKGDLIDTKGRLAYGSAHGSGRNRRGYSNEK